MFDRMLLRAFCSLIVPFLVLGCVESEPSGTTGSSSTGDIPLGPPPKIVWSATSLTDAPTARHAHTAVWTGSKMIIWGGDIGGMPSVTNTGGIYDPETDTWKPTSTTGAPAPRFSHVAAWTGSKMLIWGGFGTSNLEPAGGLYDPETDTWTAMSTTGQPALRTQATAVWTGSKLIVWGGITGSNPVGTGGMYDPATDTWAEVNPAGAPSPRVGHRAAWSGKVMLIWGGNNFSDWLSTGAYFDPEGGPTGVWTNTTASPGAPPARERHTLEFGQSAFIVWGGWNGGPTVDNGGLIEPTKNAWIATNTAGAPSARTNHVGIWAGTHLFVWGGCSENLCTAASLVANGGQFVPDSMGGTWYPIDAQADLTARYSPTAVHAGDYVIVWGGRLDPQTRTNTGARASLL